MAKATASVTETTVSKYTMRDLKTKDIFAMSKILKKMNIKGELDPKDKTPEKFGQEFLMTILENVGEAEAEFNAFFGSLIGLSATEFADLEIEDVFEVMQQFKKQDGIKRFLQLMK